MVFTYNLNLYCFLVERECPEDTRSVELTYENYTPFTVVCGEVETRPMFLGGPCITSPADTVFSITPNFEEDYVLMMLCVSVTDADSVRFSIRTQRRRNDPPIISRVRVRDVL